jgi:hypothetical protein
MISSQLKTICFYLLLASVTSLQARVNVLPSTGVKFSSTPEVSIKDTITLKAEKTRTKPLQYRLSVLHDGSQKIKPERVKVYNRFIQNPQTLDRYQTFLSGKEKGNPIKTTLEFTATWRDEPGNYNGLLMPSESAPEIPVKINISPRSSILLRPTNLIIATSSAKAPIISEVEVLMGSNSPRWELHAEAKNLIKLDDRKKINNEKVFVRIKNKNNPGRWISLNGRTKLVSGKATPVRSVATLQFRVESDLDDRAGDYTGEIKFLIRNIQ